MLSPRPVLASPQVFRVPRLGLRLSEAPWPLAVDHADEISAHFAKRQAANPAFYDGKVLVLREARHEADAVTGLCSVERFSAFLYWRDGLASDNAVLDGFATALVKSSDGAIMAVRAAPGTLNAGAVYLPGGFIDERDVTADGHIDIDGSASRELAEETGLDARPLERVPGYVVVRQGRHCCFCIVFHSSQDAERLRAEMREGAARDEAGEIAEIIAIRDARDLDRHQVLAHARLLIEFILAPRG